MNYAPIHKYAAATAAALLLALPAAAQTAVPTAAAVNVNAAAGVRLGTTTVRTHFAASTTAIRGASSTADRMQKAEDMGKAAIEKRIQSLTSLSSRIGQMKRLSATEVAALQASISAEVGTLTSLESTIANDTSTTSLKADVQSITKAYRVYLLVLPQAQIAAASDRLLATATELAALSDKLSARISAAASAGTDVAALQSTLADLNAKVADGETNANAAVAETASLSPDNGDATVRASNTAALKDARTKLSAARADLTAAYKDAQTIAAGVKGTGSVSATTSAVSASANATASAAAK